MKSETRNGVILLLFGIIVLLVVVYVAVIPVVLDEPDYRTADRIGMMFKLLLIIPIVAAITIVISYLNRGGYEDR